MKTTLRFNMYFFSLLLLAACSGGGQISGMWGQSDGLPASNDKTSGVSVANGATTEEQHLTVLETFEQIQTQAKPVEKALPKPCLGYLPKDVDAVVQIDFVGLENSLIWSQIKESSLKEIVNQFGGDVQELCVGLKYSESFKKGPAASNEQKLESGSALLSEANQGPQQMLQLMPSGDSPMINKNANKALSIQQNLQQLNAQQDQSNQLVQNQLNDNLSIESNLQNLSSGNSIVQEAPANADDGFIDSSKIVENYVAVVFFKEGKEDKAKAFFEKFEEQKKAAIPGDDDGLDFENLVAGVDKNVFMIGYETMMSSVMQGGNITAASSHPFASPLAAIRAGTNLKFAGMIPSSVMDRFRHSFSVAENKSAEDKTDFAVFGATASAQKLYLHALMHLGEKSFLENDPFFEALFFLKTEDLSIDKLTSFFSKEEESAEVPQSPGAEYAPPPNYQAPEPSAETKLPDADAEERSLTPLLP